MNRRYGTVFQIPDSDSPLPAVMVFGNGFGLGVGHINDVVVIYDDSAGPAVLSQLGDIVSILIENLNSIEVIVVSNE